jgi:hypothetical protein
MSNQNTLILTVQSDKNLSKLQKQFNSNVKKINELKEKLVKDAQQLELIRSRIQADIVPLEYKHIDKVVEMVYLFDKHYDDKFFKKKEKEKIADFILTKSEELIEQAGKEELKVMFDKYADQTYDEIAEETETESLDMIKQMMKDLFNVELNEEEENISDPDLLKDIFEKKLEEKEAFQEAPKKEKKKTAKQLEKEEKLKEEAQNVNKAARSIYTDLVKTYHPDREPDEAERERKTEIMKQITQAYEKNDLFELLRLKISLQSIDINAWKMADEQLKYYNKLLKEQIIELEREHWELYSKANIPSGNLFQRFGYDHDTTKTRIKREMTRIKTNIKSLESEIEMLRMKENMRVFLKNYVMYEDDFF